jgi:hypothetical protein
MIKFARIVAALLICIAAAYSVRNAYSSSLWVHIQMLQIKMHLYGVESRIYIYFIDSALAAFLGGVFSTLLLLAARLSPLKSSLLASAAVLLGAEYDSWIEVLFFGDDMGILPSHMIVSAIFFASGWLITTLVMRQKRGSESPRLL